MSNQRTIELSKPTSINDTDVIIVLDTVARNDSTRGILVRSQTPGYSRIVLTKDEVLKKARSENPGVSVIGIWSLLIENQMITLDALQYMEMGDGKGIYCLVENEVVVESGFYTGNAIPSRPDLTLSQGRLIPNSLDALKRLPPVILTPAERQSEINKNSAASKKRRGYIFLGFVALGVIAGKTQEFLITDDVTDANDSDTALIELQKQFSELKATRAGSITKSKGLNTLIWLANSDHYLTTSERVSMDDGQFTVIFTDATLIPQGVRYEQLADGRASVTWSSDEY